MNKDNMVEWIATHHTGLSSIAMWSALMGRKRARIWFGIPHDAGDAKHPEDCMAKSMSEGKGFAPVDGRCWCCRHKNARHNHAHRRGAPEEEVFIIKLGERV